MFGGGGRASPGLASHRIQGVGRLLPRLLRSGSSVPEVSGDGVFPVASVLLLKDFSGFKSNLQGVLNTQH